MEDIKTGWMKFETEYNGNMISMELLPMETMAMLDLLDLATGDPKAIMPIIEPYFEKYVRNIDGITINGDPPKANQFATVGRLYALAMVILTELGMISQLSENERKNLKGLSGLPALTKQEPSE